MNLVIQNAKRLRMLSRSKSQSYAHQYAFVGLGSHALNNLYPVLQYLHVPIKCIVTRSMLSVKAAQEWFPGVKATNNLETVLEDKSITSFFICTDPGEHFNILSRLIHASKNVFIEKPICQTMHELTEIIRLQEQNHVNILTGMQKRYAPSVRRLKKQITQVLYYTLEYKTGLYPEGNPVTDLFVHPLDLVLFLFGDATVISIQKVPFKGSLTIFLHLKHVNGTTGSLELTTAYSWSNAYERLYVLDKKGSAELINCSQLTYTPNSAALLGIPIEKVLQGNSSHNLCSKPNGFIPTLENNPVYTGGFYHELSSFLKLCEGKKATNLSSPKQLLSTYSILQNLAG